MSDDEDKKKVVRLDSVRQERRRAGGQETQTRAVVRDDQVLLVTGPHERVLLIMEPEGAYGLARALTVSAAELSSRRATTDASLRGRAVFIWCDATGKLVSRFQYPAIALLRREGRIFAEPDPENWPKTQWRNWENRPRVITKLPKAGWFDGMSGFPAEREEGRRFWRLCALWMPQTAKMARGW